MALYCEFINLIIPISKIEQVYKGGFQKFKQDRVHGFSRRLYHDSFLFRIGAMNYHDIKIFINEWEALGLKGIVEVNGEKQWLDFCVVEGMFGGPTFPCNWLEYDKEKNIVYLKGKPKGQTIGPV